MQGAQPLHQPDSKRSILAVVAAYLLFFSSFGVYYGLPTIFPRWAKEFGVGQGVIGWIPSIANCFQLALAGTIGGLVELIGIKRTIGLGCILTTASVLLLATCNDIISIFFAFSFLFGIGLSYSYAPVMGVVSQWFQKHRGLGIGLAAAGSGCGNLVFALLIESLSSKFSWRAATLISGAIMAVLCFFGFLLLHPRLPFESKLDKWIKARSEQLPEQKLSPPAAVPVEQKIEEKELETIASDSPSLSVISSSPDEDEPKKEQAENREADTAEPSELVVEEKETEQNEEQKEEEPSPSLLEQVSVDVSPSSESKDSQIQSPPEPAASTPTPTPIIVTMKLAPLEVENIQNATFKKLITVRVFLLMYISGAFLSYGYLVPFVHLVSLSIHTGLSSAQGASFLAVMGAASICGRIFLGFIADRVGRMYVYRFSVLSMGVATILLPFSNSAAPILAYSIVYGLFAGAFISILPPLISEYFGVRSTAKVMGFLQTGSAVGSLFGPPVAGFLFDATSSYVAGMGLSGASMVASWVLLMIMPVPEKMAPVHLPGLNSHPPPLVEEKK